MVLTIIIFQGLIFVGLIFILRHFMKGHVDNATGHLQKLNEELSKQQTDWKQKLAESQKEYELRMAKLQNEMGVQQSKAREEAVKTIEDARSRAMLEREKIINEAVDTREKIRQEIMAEMEDKAIQHSKSLISQFIAGPLRKIVHDYLIDEVEAGIREISTEHFQIQTDSAELICAEPLDPEAKKRLKKVLEDKIKKEVHLKEEVDPALIGGVVLRFGTFVIDGSLTHQLQESAAKLKKETARRYQGI